MYLQCVFAPKDDVIYMDNTYHLGSNKETGIKFGLFQSTGFELLAIYFQKFSRALPKFISGLVQLENLPSSIFAYGEKPRGIST
jgi:hypothetical protein